MKDDKSKTRPKARGDKKKGEAVDRGNKAAKRRADEYKMDKKASGGMCRGMGAAKRGGKYSKSG